MREGVRERQGAKNKEERERKCGGREGVRERQGAKNKEERERKCGGGGGGGGFTNKTCLNLGCLQPEMSVPWLERKR